ncbi:adenosine deaminase, partial [Pseudomonas aeruginosa]
ESVLSKGQWLKRDGKKVQKIDFPLNDYGTPFALDFELSEADFQFSMPFGLEMVNDVITKPYSINIHVNDGDLSTEHDECFLVLIDREGKWRVNTLLKGFATHVEGFASSYSSTGDIILIGKSAQAMLQAFNEMKAMNGGVVLVENGAVVEK